MFVFDLVPLHHWTEIAGLGTSPFKDFSGWWNQIIYRIVSPPKRLKDIYVSSEDEYFCGRDVFVEWKKSIWLWFRICLFCLFVFCLVVWLFVFFVLFVLYTFIYIPFLVTKGLQIHSCFVTEIVFQSYILAYPRFLCLVWWSESFP